MDRVLFISTFDDRVNDRAVSLPEYDELLQSQTSFTGLGAYVNGGVTVGDPGRAPDRFDAAYCDRKRVPRVGTVTGDGASDTAGGGPPGW